MAGTISVQFIQFCIQWSSIALLYYDYILTFGMEVRYVWAEKFRFSTLLYACCRYSLVANVVYLLTIANKINGKHFLDWPYHSDVMRSLNNLCTAAVIIVWAARTWAVFNKNRWIILFIGSIGLTVIALDTVQVVTLSCKGNSTTPTVGGVLAILMSVFEICSFGLTTFRSIQALNVNGVWWKQRKGFNYLILEQGVLYFCVVTVLTIASLILNVTIPGGFLQRLLNAYTVPLSGFMTARFLLHIRKWEAKRSAFQTSTKEDKETRTGTDLDFHHSQPPIRSGISQLESQGSSSGFAVSLLNDFGEDPVRRARVEAAATVVYGTGDNAIVEEPRM